MSSQYDGNLIAALAVVCLKRADVSAEHLQIAFGVRFIDGNPAIFRPGLDAVLEPGNALLPPFLDIPVRCFHELPAFGLHGLTKPDIVLRQCGQSFGV
jgi:hypothetical protein